MKKKPNLSETEYLLSTEANRKHLEDSVQELEEGKVVRISKNPNEIAADIFNMLHDGTIEEITVQDDLYTCKISIEYLASLFNPKFEYLFLKIQWDNIHFVAWGKDSGSKSMSSQNAVELDLEISSATIEEKILNVYMNASDPMFSGGKICANVQKIHISTEKGEPVDYLTLIQKTSTYWDNFENSSETKN